MGCTSFFDENVDLDNNARVKCTPQRVEVADNHGVPQLVVESIGDPNKMLISVFNNWEQFERFVEAVNAVESRLSPIHK